MSSNYVTMLSTPREKGTRVQKVLNIPVPLLTSYMAAVNAKAGMAVYPRASIGNPVPVAINKKTGLPKFNKTNGAPIHQVDVCVNNLGHTWIDNMLATASMEIGQMIDDNPAAYKAEIKADDVAAAPIIEHENLLVAQVRAEIARQEAEQEAERLAAIEAEKQVAKAEIRAAAEKARLEKEAADIAAVNAELQSQLDEILASKQTTTKESRKAVPVA